VAAAVFDGGFCRALTTVLSAAARVTTTTHYRDAEVKFYADEQTDRRAISRDVVVTVVCHGLHPCR